MNHLHATTQSTRFWHFALALVILIVAACGATPAPATAAITAPTSNAQLVVGQAVNIEGKATGSALKAVDVYVDGVKYATINTASASNAFVVSAPWTPPLVGTHVVQLKGIDDKSNVVVESEAVFVTVKAPQATATPEQPTPTVQPTGAATAQPTVQAATPLPAATATPQVALATVKEGGSDYVNVRSGPGVGYDRVGQLNKGQSAPVKGKSEDSAWWQISFPAGPDGLGWVIGTLVTITGDTTGTPVVKVAPPPTSAAPPPTPVAQATATSSLPPSALLPYSQRMQFSPRDTLDWQALGVNEASTLVWSINGATKLELQIDAPAAPDIYDNCPAGNLAAINPNDAAGKRRLLTVPDGTYPFTIGTKGYYIFTIFVVKADGSTTSIPRGIVVDCVKKPGR